MKSRRRFLAAAPGCAMAALCLGCAALCAGCTGLLPTGSAQASLPWKDYDAAVQALQAVVPRRSTRLDLHRQGIDPRTNPSVLILNYTDLLQRLPAATGVPPEKLDKSIADCLLAGTRCSGYQISVRQVQSRHVGNFWLDMLNFRRDVVTTGWSFNALIILVDDVVVFALSSGQPKIEDEQISRNPLGPLQGLGESLHPPVP
jgi:hypothetical protein